MTMAVHNGEKQRFRPSSAGCVLCGGSVQPPYVHWNLPPPHVDIIARICTQCCCKHTDRLMADMVQVRAIATLNKIPGFEGETLRRNKIDKADAEVVRMDGEWQKWQKRTPGEDVAGG
jgi:hypothetical protein